MEFYRQEYWSGLLSPPPVDLSDPRIEPTSLAYPALAGGFFTTIPPGKPHMSGIKRNKTHTPAPIPWFKKETLIGVFEAPQCAPSNIFNG